jgi:hypothetical protein
LNKDLQNKKRDNNKCGPGAFHAPSFRKKKKRKTFRQQSTSPSPFPEMDLEFA